MTYYERKAMKIRDHCLAHPWNELIEVLVMDAEIKG